MTAPRPMLAALADFALVDPALIYEPKYDGIRAIADITNNLASVRLWSRRGNEKTAQFPDIVAAIRSWAATRGRGATLDGEIVALDAAGRVLGFQKLQPRIHLADEERVGRLSSTQPVAFIAFDLLREADEDLRSHPLAERRARLEALFAGTGAGMSGGALRMSEASAADGRELWRRAQSCGWEGIVAKEARSPYREGQRSAEWRKRKLVMQQEFAVGGWVDSPTGRPIGALMLGVYDRGQLVYVGHTGRGFSDRELVRVSRMLASRVIESCPFSPPPRASRTFHWVRPELVAEIRFSEWTAAGKLREPIYLGMREDVVATAIEREA